MRSCGGEPVLHRHVGIQPFQARRSPGRRVARHSGVFLANPVVHEIVIDRDVGRVYAEIVVALRKAGTPLPTNDIWIAAAAARSGATVLTYDSHGS